MDSIIMVQVSSSNLLAVGYDKGSRILRIAFHGGRTYDYFDVPPDVYRALIDAPSLGRYLNAVIRKRYRYRQVI
jgi:hypothetical protein